MQSTRQKIGKTSYLAGLAAEASVAQSYTNDCHKILAQRWRGSAGEIDLISTDGISIIFTEVKKARSLQAAARSLSAAQMQRIMATACEYLEETGKSQDTDMRFDVALVDEKGQIQILENALMQ